MKNLSWWQYVWDAVKEEYVEPKNLAGSSETVKKAAKEARMKDQEALSLIQLGVDDNVFEKIGKAITTKKKKKKKHGIRWRVLSRALNVKKVRFQSLRGEFESLQMKDSETDFDYISRVFSVMNQLERNDEEMDDSGVVDKILRSLNPKFNYVIVAIKESNDIETMIVDKLSGK
ncbi:hypothetical protein RJ640_029905 [Escallonia rubra]|uniref:Uncharacterized protein n=1 Tax=Escallonia rubra TaxID=112253 RepID=A0AA88QKG4_9ASTE|nr:hypothetical protein RJ640_029905 [Escallonia rubra]